ncbi:hypothetical protein OE88DRAFT_1648888 [Heliocybe sulcata]|uniref:Uncharacterized protein n=1 Tax=Heliocybe sulcata TaxID=5364 RepID=A0A5C3MX25_9AGAM|nr:hypothetical protein OE88DRAFT_1648888 [Heliocybe sulcata]
MTTLITLLLLVLLGLAPRHHASAPRATQTVTIQGRWKDTRASLGLPPVPDTVVLQVTPPVPPGRTISRIELRRRISSGQQEGEPELHFTEDALEEPKLSLREIGNMFRETILAEKASAPATPRTQGRKKATG